MGATGHTSRNVTPKGRKVLYVAKENCDSRYFFDILFFLFIAQIHLEMKS